jgi:hypothetical protein
MVNNYFSTYLARPCFLDSDSAKSTTFPAAKSIAGWAAEPVFRIRRLPALLVSLATAYEKYMQGIFPGRRNDVPCYQLLVDEHSTGGQILWRSTKSFSHLGLQYGRRETLVDKSPNQCGHAQLYAKEFLTVFNPMSGIGIRALIKKASYSGPTTHRLESTSVPKSIKVELTNSLGISCIV